MILLFFVFPRFSTNFIGFKTGRPPSRGFGESLEPGSVSRLIESDQPAFHARFYSDPPSLTEMYWRGIVFTINQGMKWTRLSPAKRDINPPKNFPEDTLRQEILMEPVLNNRLFSIDRSYWIQHKNRALQKLTKKTENLNFILDRTYNKNLSMTPIHPKNSVIF